MENYLREGTFKGNSYLIILFARRPLAGPTIYIGHSM